MNITRRSALMIRRWLAAPGLRAAPAFDCDTVRVSTAARCGIESASIATPSSYGITSTCRCCPTAVRYVSRHRRALDVGRRTR